MKKHLSSRAERASSDVGIRPTMTSGYVAGRPHPLPLSQRERGGIVGHPLKLTHPHRGRAAAVAALVALLLTAAPLPGGEREAIEGFLKREILGPTLHRDQWRRFCDVRVPTVKTPATAEQWQAEAQRLRAAVLERVVFRGAAAEWRNAKTKVEWLETIAGGPGYSIKKLRYEALPGFWIPALLYQPERIEGKAPVVMNVNGHVGAPGKSVAYKQIRCINQAKRGMLALNVEWIGMGQLGGEGYSHARMNQLDLCGTSGLAPFYLSMQRGLDVLLALPHADPQRVAVAGLSGGGWQTIFISALDPRVTLANPVAGYSSFLTRTEHFKDLGDSEQTPCDLATLADYTHLTAMRAPRPTLLTYNSKDECCFESGYALPPLLAAAQPVFALCGRPDALRSHVNDVPGTHNFELDNRQAFYRMLGDFFYAGQKDFDPKEIASDSEVKTKEQLLVELPPGNADFHSLAAALAKDLPRQPAPPAQEPQAAAWRQTQREKLRELVRAQSYEVHATQVAAEEADGIRAVLWKLELDEAWTVPAVELTKGEPRQTALLLLDGGRKTAAAEAARLLAEGYRVVVLDPIGVGEAAVAGKEYLAALLVAGVGQRPLGLQASQILAAARWSAERDQGRGVTLAAVGRRAGVWALVAAALDDRAIARVVGRESLGSLKQVIAESWPIARAPELFCFGLLEQFELSHLAALAVPRPVELAPADAPAAKPVVPTADKPEKPCACDDVASVQYDPRKHLVLDPRIIEKAEGARLAMGRVEKSPRNPLFRADKPWENALNNLYPNVVFDPQAQLFKLWYKCVLSDKEAIAKMMPPATVHDVGWFLLYAESEDGLAWRKPELGLVGFDGSTKNNIVARDTPNVGVFRDARDPDPARRYKMLYDVGRGQMRVRSSADGLRWGEPQTPDGFTANTGDTHNNAFWDERLGKYVCITRFYLGERLVARSESRDFLHWENTRLALRSLPDEGKDRQLYCMPAFACGSGYLGLLMVYRATGDRTVDCELAWSPDTIEWRRVLPGTPLIPRGPQGSCDSACIYAQAGPPTLCNGRLMLFYGGSDVVHRGWKRHCLPCLATLRPDGFAAYEPADKEQAATLVTTPLRCVGEPLRVSADARGGTIRVAVVDREGFELAACEPIVENVTDAVVRWQGGRSLESLKGQTVRLRFELRGGAPPVRLYAFRGLELASSQNHGNKNTAPSSKRLQ